MRKLTLLWTSFMTLQWISLCTAACTTEQLDVSQIQRALDKCRRPDHAVVAPIRGASQTTTGRPAWRPLLAPTHRHNSPDEMPTSPRDNLTPRTVVLNTAMLLRGPVISQSISHFRPGMPFQGTVEMSSDPEKMEPETSQEDSPVGGHVTPPRYPGKTDPESPRPVEAPGLEGSDRNPDLESAVWPKRPVKEDISTVRTPVQVRRTPRGFGGLQNDATPPVNLKLAAGSWNVGALDKKCVFYCAFVELGLMDEDGRLVEGSLRRLLEGAARSPELRARAGELAELCQYKMLHVSTLDATQLECDFPLMLTRCILGRLSKHCEERRGRERMQLVTMHPDVELF